MTVTAVTVIEIALTTILSAIITASGSVAIVMEVVTIAVTMIIIVVIV